MNGKALLSNYMRRATTLATHKDAPLPLHASSPHVGLVDWSTIDALVKTNSNAAEEKIYAMCHVYRTQEAAESLYAELPQQHKNEGEAALLGNDIITLQECEFAERSPPQTDQRSVSQTIKVFSVVELQKNRRRVITWPKQLNAIERRRLREIREQGGDVLFPTIENIVKNARRCFSAQADFTKYFQQFPLAPDCRRFFTFAYRGTVFEILTVPTGAVSVPLWTQVVTRCIALDAIRTAGAQLSVFFDCVIDNVRFVSDSLEDLCSVWQHFKSTCKRLNITLGDSMEPGLNNYTFLGIRFSTKNRNDACSISIGDKTCSKLRAAAHLLKLSLLNQHQLLIHEALAFFGITMFASTVAASTTGGQTPLHSRNHFLIFKYMRRLGHRTASLQNWKMTLDSPANVWPCIIQEWIDWCLQLASFNEVLCGPSTTTSGTLYTDASDSGWGIIYFGHEGKVFSAGGKWSTFEKRQIIAERELRAVTIGLDLVQAKWPLIQNVDILVDNTNAISWMKKGRSRRYAANEMCAKVASHRVKISTLSFVASAANKADFLSRL